MVSSHTIRVNVKISSAFELFYDRFVFISASGDQDLGQDEAQSS